MKETSRPQKKVMKLIRLRTVNVISKGFHSLSVRIETIDGRSVITLSFSLDEDEEHFNSIVLRTSGDFRYRGQGRFL